MDTALVIKSPATEAQIKKIHEVLDEKYAPAEAAGHHEWMNTHIISTATASAALKRLFAMPNVNGLDEGMYRMNDEIFKVYRTQAGHLATKQLIEGCFEYTGRKPLHSLKAEHRMTLVEAQEYGRITGICCNCGRKLTNEESIEAGIGPICAGKF